MIAAVSVRCDIKQSCRFFFTPLSPLADMRSRGAGRGAGCDRWTGRVKEIQGGEGKIGRKKQIN